MLCWDADWFMRVLVHVFISACALGCIDELVGSGESHSLHLWGLGLGFRLQVYKL
jgi:hypothetical protein